MTHQAQDHTHNTPAIQAREITINRGEGPTNQCRKPQTYTRNDKDTAWTQANRTLRQWALSAPKDGGYDKVDYCVTYDDGTQYAGRFDMKYEHTTAPYALLQSDIRSSVQFNTGQMCPHWMNKDRYDEYIQSCVPNTQDYINFLKTYEL